VSAKVCTVHVFLSVCVCVFERERETERETERERVIKKVRVCECSVCCEVCVKSERPSVYVVCVYVVCQEYSVYWCFAGVVVAMPIFYATGSKWKAFFWATMSGVAEPIGATLGYVVLVNVCYHFSESDMSFCFC